MRTIKFRIFDKENLKMNHPDGYVLENTWFGVTTEHYLDESHVKDYPMKSNSYILMQYTGLKDKNGKEIYEGDIVKCGYGIGKVIYNAGCFMIEWIDDKEAMMEFIFSRDGIYPRRHGDEFLEIIGNIHQNPELLK